MICKFAMLLAVCMVCMPIGGLTASGSTLPAEPIATACPVSSPWLIEPAPILLLCVVLLFLARIDYRHKQQLLSR